MTKGTKIALIVGIVVVVGVGGYFLYQRLTKDSSGEGEGEGEGQGNENKGGNTNTISNDINAPVNNVVVDEAPPTPFQNKYQGDYFRIWINREYPKYAGLESVDLKGAYNNSTIRKAWKKYGQEFSKKDENENIFKVNSAIPSIFYEKGINKNYILGISKSGIVYLETNKKVIFFADGMWYKWVNKDDSIKGKWWDGGKQAGCSKDVCGEVKNVKADNFQKLSDKIVSTYKHK